MGILPLTTARLHLRVMKLADAPVLASYRSLPDIARFQDWAMPYSVENAVAALADQEDRDDLAQGMWIQVAIEADTPAGRQVVGDVAIGWMADGYHAFIGYTLAPQHQGHGYAGEAAAALIDSLFARTEIRRFVATMDPENFASMRVIENLGFRYEGVATQAELVRGEWLDDMRFALLREEREAWRNRPRHVPTDIRLVEIGPGEARDWFKLETHRYQRQFVADMPASFADAAVPELVEGELAVPWFRGIEADGERVGFVMMAEPSDATPQPYLWRLLIDRWHQRRGIASRVMAQIIDRARATGADELHTSFYRAPGGPERFYLGLGFAPNGEMLDDEVMVVLSLR